MSSYIPPECQLVDVLFEKRFLTGSDTDAIDTEVVNPLDIFDDSLNWIL